MRLSRRQLLQRSSAVAGGLLLASPAGLLAQPLGAGFDTSRASRLFPGTWLVHADLHNHTLLSDGDGDPALAFESMRSAGLDVAALTDHATVQKLGDPVECLGQSDCQGVAGIDEASWQRLRQIADDADDLGAFTAIRGFEWSSPALGHVNVWFSETWTDPLATGGIGPEGMGQLMHDNVPGLGEVVGPPLDAGTRNQPTSAGMALFHEWLTADPSRPAIGGGLDGIAGFNHPGRETGRFGYFAFDPAVRDRFVSLEVFNRGEDYLFEGTELGVVSPLVECLDAGWRVGLLGVTDEHGTSWGYPDGKGRGGLWVEELSRPGVRDAMTARRFFATRLKGLRLDAAATSGRVPDRDAHVRMGGELAHTSGPVTFELDIDRGSEWVGQRLLVQVLRSGGLLPTVVATEEITVPAPGSALPRLTVDLDRADGEWVVLRLTDPTQQADGRATGEYVGAGDGVAYCAPWYLV